MRNKEVFFLLPILLLLSCSDDDVQQELTTELNLTFDHHVGGEDLELSGQIYEKNAGEHFRIDTLKYIISNIELQLTNGDTFKYPVEESYFVINEKDPSSLSIDLEDIPADNYDKIRFGFGIDQSNYPLNGVDNFVPTAEENGMLWSWSAGYKFLKLEGEYGNSIAEVEQKFLYHVGSHGENLDNYKVVELDLGETLRLDQDGQSIRIDMDVLKIFNAVHAFEIAEKDDIQVDPVNAPKIAENMKNSFQVDAIVQTSE